MSMLFRIFAVSDEVATNTLADPERIDDLLISLDDSPSALSLEKSWHGLHYLLTGSQWEGDAPLNFLTSGGEEVGDVDVGYGPARILSVQQVKVIDEALQTLPQDYVGAKLDPAALEAAKIYPPIWQEPREHLVKEYTGFLEELKSYVKATAGANQALLLVVQ